MASLGHYIQESSAAWVMIDVPPSSLKLVESGLCRGNRSFRHPPADPWTELWVQSSSEGRASQVAKMDGDAPQGMITLAEDLVTTKGHSDLTGMRMRLAVQNHFEHVLRDWRKAGSDRKHT